MWVIATSLHYDDESVPVEEIITTLDGLVRGGKIRAIAASNITPARLAAALEFSAREGLTSYVALQPHYNLVSRDTYEGECAVAEQHRLGVLPYSGLPALLAGVELKLTDAELAKLDEASA
jgi:aryl-alcohol dehydrogenase-like predicted oxidoreductase